MPIKYISHILHQLTVMVHERHKYTLNRCGNAGQSYWRRTNRWCHGRVTLYDQDRVITTMGVIPTKLIKVRLKQMKYLRHWKEGQRKKPHQFQNKILRSNRGYFYKQRSCCSSSNFLIIKN